jgi:hypothetical protein
MSVTSANITDHAERDLGASLRIEAVLLSLIIFLGINVAWALMFDEVDDLATVGQGHEHA